MGPGLILFIHSASAPHSHLSEWHHQALSCQPRVFWWPSTSQESSWSLPCEPTFNRSPGPYYLSILYCCHLHFGHCHCLLGLTGFPMLSLPSPVCFSCCGWSAFLKIKWKSDALFPQRAQGKNQVTAVQASRWSEKKKGDPQVSSWFSAQLAM